MKNLKNFLKKLDQMNFNGVTENGNIVTPEGWAVSQSLTFFSLAGDASYIQTILRVSFNGLFVEAYGAENAKESVSLAEWFDTKHRIANLTQMNERSRQQTEARNKFTLSQF